MATKPLKKGIGHPICIVCKLVADAGQTEDRVRELALKYYPTKEEAEAEIVKGIHAVQLYEITIEHMTGKRIHEK